MELIIVLLNIFVVVEIYTLLVLSVMIMNVGGLIRNCAFKARS